jgi:hypothetical protein
MLPQLTQETLNEYAHDAQTTQQPYGADYTQGVRVGKTIPAKWWNWLFNAATKRIFQSKNDAQDMLTEMKNVVTDAGLTPDASDNTQLNQAIEEKADIQIGKYIEKEKRRLGTLFTSTKPIYIDDEEYSEFINTTLYRTQDLSVGTDVLLCAHDYYNRVVLSCDGVHWYTFQYLLRLAGLISSDTYISLSNANGYRYIARTNGYYYVVVSKTVGYGNTERKLARFSISNCRIISYTEISAPATSESQEYNGFIVAVKDKLYWYTYKGQLLKIVDGSTSVTQLTAQWTSSYPSEHSKSLGTALTPVYTRGKYYAGNLSIDYDTDTISELYHASSVAYTAANLTTRLLPNGVVAIIQTDNSYSDPIDGFRYLRTDDVIIYSSSYRAVAFSEGSSMYSNAQSQIKDYVLLRSINTNWSAKYAYYFDGAYFTELPVNGANYNTDNDFSLCVLQLGNNFYIAGGLQGKIYYIENALSGTLSDYTEIQVLNTQGSIHDYTNLIYSGIDDIVYCRGYAVRGTEVIGSVQLLEGGSLSPLEVPFNACKELSGRKFIGLYRPVETHSGVNRVDGYTLYLR